MPVNDPVPPVNPTNASAVSDAPHSQRAGRLGELCGARPIQLFEGSRPWGGTYAN